jgi:hypothetical protein
MNLPRRTFLLSATGAIAAHAFPPSDQVTLGVIGTGGRGTFVMGVFLDALAAGKDVYVEKPQSSGRAVEVPTMTTNTPGEPV